MFCVSCGSKLPEVARFCPSCGIPALVASTQETQGTHSSQGPVTVQPQPEHTPELDVPETSLVDDAKPAINKEFREKLLDCILDFTASEELSD